MVLLLLLRRSSSRLARNGLRLRGQARSARTPAADAAEACAGGGGAGGGGGCRRLRASASSPAAASAFGAEALELPLRVAAGRRARRRVVAGRGGGRGGSAASGASVREDAGGGLRRRGSVAVTASPVCAVGAFLKTSSGRVPEQPGRLPRRGRTRGRRVRCGPGHARHRHVALRARHLLGGRHHADGQPQVPPLAFEEVRVQDVRGELAGGPGLQAAVQPVQVAQQRPSARQDPPDALRVLLAVLRVHARVAQRGLQGAHTLLQAAASLAVRVLPPLHLLELPDAPAQPRLRPLVPLLLLAQLAPQRLRAPRVLRRRTLRLALHALLERGRDRLDLLRALRQCGRALVRPLLRGVGLGAR
eukprot:Rhum_TRINITY_DN14168_c0_g2::Rhum_TRINITY_DN14168_c0_g2_i1::g.70355::m.70355